MNGTTKLLGLTAACAACCAIPIVIPALAGLGFAGLAAAVGGWGPGAAVLVTVAAVGIVFMVQRRMKATACASADPQA